MTKTTPKDEYSLEFDIAQLRKITESFKKKKAFTPEDMIEATNCAYNLLTRLRNNAQLLTDSPELSEFLGTANDIIVQLHQVAQDESKRFATPNAMLKKLTDGMERFLNKTMSHKKQVMLRKALGIVPWIDGVVEVSISLPYYFKHADRTEKIALIFSSTLLLVGMAASVALLCSPLAIVYPFIAPAIPTIVLCGRVTFAQVLHNSRQRYEDKAKFEGTLAMLSFIENGMAELKNEIGLEEEAYDNNIKNTVSQLDELTMLLQRSNNLTPADLKLAADQAVKVLQILNDAATFIPDNPHLEPLLVFALDIVQNLQAVAADESAKLATPETTLNKISKKFNDFIKDSVSSQNYVRFRKMSNYFSGFDGIVELCVSMPRYFPQASRNEKIAMVLSATLLLTAFAAATAILCSPAAPAIPFIMPVLGGTVAAAKFIFNKAIANAKVKYSDKHEIDASVEQFAKIELGMQDLLKNLPKRQKLLEYKPHITIAEQQDIASKAEQHREKLQQKTPNTAKDPKNKPPADRTN